MADNDQQDLEHRAQAAFQRELRRLEPRARDGLAAARREALAAAGPGPSWLPGRSPIWMPVGAAALAATALAVVLIQRSDGTDYAELATAAPSVEDMEILLGEEDFELLDNLDFYLWLDEQTEAG